VTGGIFHGQKYCCMPVGDASSSYPFIIHNWHQPPDKTYQHYSLFLFYTVSQKNDTDVAHYDFIAHQLILVNFGRDVADRVCYQRLFVIPPLLTNVFALPGEMLKCKNCICSLTCSISVLPDFDRLLAQFIQSCYSQLILLLLYGSLNLVVIGVKLWTILGPLPTKKDGCFAQ